jgi:hypothetical protein
MGANTLTPTVQEVQITISGLLAKKVILGCALHWIQHFRLVTCAPLTPRETRFSKGVYEMSCRTRGLLERISVGPVLGDPRGAKLHVWDPRGAKLHVCVYKDRNARNSVACFYIGASVRCACRTKKLPGKKKYLVK